MDLHRKIVLIEFAFDDTTLEFTIIEDASDLYIFDLDSSVMLIEGHENFSIISFDSIDYGRIKFIFTFDAFVGLESDKDLFNYEGCIITVKQDMSKFNEHIQFDAKELLSEFFRFYILFN